jgi:ech hydrogenase subunit A
VYERGKIMYPLILIVLPLVFAAVYQISNKERYYRVVSFFMLALLSTAAMYVVLRGTALLKIDDRLYETFELSIKAFEIIVIGFLYYVAIKYKKWGTLALTVVQTILTVYTFLFNSTNIDLERTCCFNIDMLTLVMVLIINVVGSLIVLFSNGYISQYEQHRKLKNRQRFYYTVICIFIAAMNGIVLCNMLSWIYFFWEVTTLTSFLLIFYNKDSEAEKSAFRALLINLIGGLAFSLGIILYQKLMGISTLSQIAEVKSTGPYYIIPVFLLCIAGFTKAAQLPFQSWLLGAMVAPTPVSALLHSSTMVKAGVYLIIELSPAYADTTLGIIIAIYGGLTFLICAMLALTQRNAKRLLAYSTISNLGLIIASAGLGTSIAISAAIMLIIFHALSKALLFLCAGEIEHAIGSRDIEDMMGLLGRAPVLTIITAVGMMSMVLPPFGMLITKWISIEASAYNPIVALLLIFGSAFTTAFWLKWLGTIMAYPANSLRPKRRLDFYTFTPILMLALLIVGASIAITPIFNSFVSPEVSVLINGTNQLVGHNGKVYSEIGIFNGGAVIALIVLLMVAVLVFRRAIFSPKLKKIYVCGENTNSTAQSAEFRNGFGGAVIAATSNNYFTKYINEKKVILYSSGIACAMLIAVIIGGIARL